MRIIARRVALAALIAAAAPFAAAPIAFACGIVALDLLDPVEMAAFAALTAE
jgi:hypothetical protein